MHLTAYYISIRQPTSQVQRFSSPLSSAPISKEKAATLERMRRLRKVRGNHRNRAQPTPAVKEKGPNTRPFCCAELLLPDPESTDSILNSQAAEFLLCPWGNRARDVGEIVFHGLGKRLGFGFKDFSWRLKGTG
jgi:hypothetical protein